MYAKINFSNNLVEFILARKLCNGHQLVCLLANPDSLFTIQTILTRKIHCIWYDARRTGTDMPCPSLS
jgi:hypothetical protein